MNANTAPKLGGAGDIPLHDLVTLAVAAGREIMTIRDAGFSAVKKADGSPVTVADQRAEAVILEGLARLAPGVPVIAEEEAAAGRVPALDDVFFCVDPLDGTRDFIEGDSGEFTVNIALVRARTPIVGVIYAPATGALYAGEPGRALKGAWDARTGERVAPLAPISVAPAGDVWRVTASRRSTGKRIQSFIEALKGESEVLRSSSSIKFGMLAEGVADLYPRFGDVSEWDAAAGHAILAAAGGDLMRLDASPVRYGRADRGFIIDGFVAFGSPAAAAEALRILNA
ncbi:MAG: 3'(2'),5'-bisphosphate nucleotidase CysQ [Hyphomonadaceae bacterium]|nr:3'(2'),5'-bisphosphate nucleotidase CysQ [Hyphomonadaceae bacterium]